MLYRRVLVFGKMYEFEYSVGIIDCKYMHTQDSIFIKMSLHVLYVCVHERKKRVDFALFIIIIIIRKYKYTITPKTETL